MNEVYRYPVVDVDISARFRGGGNEYELVEKPEHPPWAVAPQGWFVERTFKYKNIFP